MRRIFILLAGLSLLAPLLVALLTGSDRDDSLFYPHPAIVLIPMLFGLRWVAFLIPTASFFASNPQLFEDRAEIPKRSYVLLSVLMLLMIPWFIIGWKDGVAVQGPRYNHLLLVIDAAWILTLWLVLLLARKKRTFGTSLLFHWLLFVWLAWYAFPFFGEMV